MHCLHACGLVPPPLYCASQHSYADPRSCRASAAPCAIARPATLGTSPVADSLGSLYGSSPSGSFVPREPAAAQFGTRTPSDGPLHHSLVDSFASSGRAGLLRSPRAASPAGRARDSPFPDALGGPGDLDDDLFGCAARSTACTLSASTAGTALQPLARREIVSKTRLRPSAVHSIARCTDATVLSTLHYIGSLVSSSTHET